jgi:hypothetical protein
LKTSFHRPILFIQTLLAWWRIFIIFIASFFLSLCWMRSLTFCFNVRFRIYGLWSWVYVACMIIWGVFNLQFRVGRFVKRISVYLFYVSNFLFHTYRTVHLVLFFFISFNLLLFWFIYHSAYWINGRQGTHVFTNLEFALIKYFDKIAFHNIGFNFWRVDDLLFNRINLIKLLFQFFLSESIIGFFLSKLLVDSTKFIFHMNKGIRIAVWSDHFYFKKG